MENDILLYAIQNFEESSGFKVEMKKHNGFDGVMCIGNPSVDQKFTFEVRKRLALPYVVDLMTNSNDDDESLNKLLVSDRISQPIKDYLKSVELSYIDTTGNAFLTNRKGFYVYIDKMKKSPISSTVSGRAFSKSGLKVVYQILLNDDILNYPYRYIGEASTVSIDTVGKVIKDLLQAKYIVKVNESNFKLIDRKRLFQEWITVFNKVLRPKLKQRRFKLRSGMLKSIIAQLSENSLGGELAAENFSDTIIAENAIVYTNESFIKKAREINLIPDDNGDVTLVEKFWNDEFVTGVKPYVDPVLIYADLMNNPTARNIEAAKLINENFIDVTI